MSEAVQKVELGALEAIEPEEKIAAVAEPLADEGQPQGLPVRAGLVPAPEGEREPARPWFRILVTATPLGFETPQPAAHYTAQKFRKFEAADVEAAAIYEEDYLPKRELIGTVAVVEMRPGGVPVVVNPRHFPEV